MSIEELRQALLRLSELDKTMNSVRSSLLGIGEDVRQEFDELKKRIEEATPGWEIQKMRNPWITTWAIFPISQDNQKGNGA